MNDDNRKLEKFLKDNRPIVPGHSHFTLNEIIWDRIVRESPRKSIRSLKWSAAGSLIVTALFTFIVMGPRHSKVGDNNDYLMELEPVSELSLALDEDSLEEIDDLVALGN